jgi:hypothetical protein
LPVSIENKQGFRLVGKKAHVGRRGGFHGKDMKNLHTIPRRENRSTPALIGFAYDKVMGAGQWLITPAQGDAMAFSNGKAFSVPTGTIQYRLKGLALRLRQRSFWFNKSRMSPICQFSYILQIVSTDAEMTPTLG